MDDGKPTQPRRTWWSRPTPPDPTPPPPAGDPSAPAPPSPPGVTAPATTHPATGDVPAPGASPAPAGGGAPAAGPSLVKPDPTRTAPATGPEAGAAPATGPEAGAVPATGTAVPGAAVAAPPGAPGPAASPDGAGAGATGHPAGNGGPLHAPDEYRTPPYGEPGPWAPAPPVQRPLAGPPPAYGAPATATAAPPHPAPVPPQWGQYDPWSSPAARQHAQPLAGHPGGAGPRRPRRGLALVGALLFALLTGVLGGAVGAYVERNGGLTTVELPQAGADVGDRAPGSVAGIAARALPSVVTLHVSGGGEQGTGTGFVLDKRGHILTNHHVVDSADGDGDITVTFSGGETADATLVGGDSGYDLAVVRVTGVANLAPLPLGNSDGVRVGDPVVAIGAPFDLQNTVTSGIISAKGRPITAGGEKGDGSDISYVDALQTDAPINPGNSGGPLLDAQARVIGINSAIRAADDGSGIDDGQAGSIGLGFAIPVNQGKRVAEELINTGKATHPVIGVSLDLKFTGDGARVADKAQDGGASVTPGGPAAKAGIRPGDVITRVDGERVHNGEELIVKIRAHRPGDELRLTVRRDGREGARTLTLGSSADN
ncbi:S1C family serine protease [Streptomyces roseolilacinus]|uniref:Protease n=1 Tax=Streptomyces roseolilacinus TaxID=66904 RepID=A0A918AX71_9ACTN|nr:trypsin-like peptidase domain-containing protein [Streptomyces roseolilacinus]GGP88691.1 protease [Streptomyces roseolilacinus]